MRFTRILSTVVLLGLIVPTIAIAQAPTLAGIKKYTFRGIHLGMTKQETLTVAKALATGPVPKDADATSFDSNGYHIVMHLARQVVDSYSVCGLKDVPNGTTHGPTLDLAVKTFGQPVSMPHGSQQDVEWEKIGGVYATYDWDEQQDTGGCFQVSRVGHPFPK